MQNTQYAGLAVVVVILSMGVALMGYMMLSLTDDGDDPEYSLSDTAVFNGTETACSGTVGYKNYNESDWEDLIGFTLKASCGDDLVDDEYVIIINAESKVPESGYTQIGTDGDLGIWTVSDTSTSSEDGTATYWVDSDGTVAKMTVLHNGYTYTVSRV